MAVEIEWTQRAAGREPGDRETVERSVFVDGVLAQGRAVLVSEDVAEEAPKPRPGRRHIESVPDAVEPEVAEVVVPEAE